MEIDMSYGEGMDYDLSNISQVECKNDECGIGGCYRYSCFCRPGSTTDERVTREETEHGSKADHPTENATAQITAANPTAANPTAANPTAANPTAGPTTSTAENPTSPSSTTSTATTKIPCRVQYWAGNLMGHHFCIKNCI